jgi:hypothetical protein
LYRVVLTVDGKDYTQNLRVVPDPNVPLAELAADEEREEQEADGMFEEEEGPEGEEGPIIR